MSPFLQAELARDRASSRSDELTVELEKLYAYAAMLRDEDMRQQGPQAAFKQITEHPAILGAIGDGAVSVYMPRLACMSDVTDRGLTFEQALAGERGSGEYPLGMFDIARVRKWWDRELVSMFSAIPAEWLPPVRTDDTSFAAE